jgi:integrase
MTRKRRRGNGEGSIYQRANGKWCATYCAGYTEQGRRRRRTIFGKTKQAVQDKLRQLTADSATRPPLEPQRIAVGEFLDRWLADAAKPALKPTTYANYAAVARNHIKPRIGGLPLSKLAVMHIQSLYADMARAGKSAETIRLTHAVLRRALRQAVNWRLVPYNVSVDVERPRTSKIEFTPLNAPQVAQLLAAVVDHRLAAIFTVAVATGMRLGELFGLQWLDVDLTAGVIMVRRSLAEISGKLLVTDPKTARSRRRIDLPQVAIDALHRHREAMAAEGFGQVKWVFCNTRGGPLRRSHFHKQVFKRLLKKANLPDIRFHDLRHTSATLLLSAGVHPKVVQERLGHSQISITLDIYSHVLPTLQREAAGKLEEMLGGGTG